MAALGLLPAATFLFVAYLVRPAGDAVAPLRLALVRAAVVVAGAAAVLVELLSTIRALTTPALVAVWAVAAAVALALTIRRYRRERPDRHDVRDRLVGAWTRFGRVERLIVLVLAAEILAELVIALVSPPNNFDSQTYHLPKIEHWVAQQDVGFYPTSIDRQLAMAPGAEYLLLHLRLLAGGDSLYNLLQLAAGIGAALFASRIAAQLGGARRAQLLAAAVVSSTPMVALESTSTQTDLVVAAWVAAVATLVLDTLHRRAPAGTVALLGTATGLAVLTKATGVLAVAPLLLLWLVAQARRGIPRALVAGLLVGVLALAVAGPYLGRSAAEYGSPLGPAGQRDMISMERHDPPAVLVNALRVAQSALQTPVGRVNRAEAAGIERLSRAMGIDPNDRTITFWGSTFPIATWMPDEDKAALPVQGVLILLGALVLLIRPRSPTTRWYAATFWVALLLFVGTVKWQPWGNRLLLFLVVLGAPLAGLWLSAVLDEVRAPALARRAGAWAAAGALVVACCAGWLAVGYGWPRRLVGPDSVFTVSDLQARFQRRPQWLADYEWVAGSVRASGARRIGLVQGYDTWEYPWWLLLRGDDIVSLRSLQPGLAPARPDSVDAIVCVSTAHLCGRYVPAGWTVRMRDGFGYALPPGRSGMP
jgi:hypothetical protein